MRSSHQPSLATTSSVLRCTALGALLVGLGLGCSFKGPVWPTLPSAELLGFEHPEGEQLLARMNCQACHAAGPDVLQRLRPHQAPDLGAVGARLSPAWLRDFLGNPRAHSLDPARGPVMPDLLGSGSVRSEDLLHYLVSLGGPMRLPRLPSLPWPIDDGRELFAGVGCQACHGQELDLARLGRQTDRTQLAGMLRQPRSRWPAGHMPDMQLTTEEADALAAFLLRQRQAAGPSQSAQHPGLLSELFHFENELAALPEFETLTPAQTSVAETVSLDGIERDDLYALRLRGELLVDEAGTYRVATHSDDGSQLFLDGALVVDNDGLHSPQMESAEVTLEAGWHALEVTMFENSGGAELAAGFLDEEDVLIPFEQHQLRSTQVVFEPDGWEAFVLDEARVHRGRRQFEKTGCAACHGVPDNGPPMDMDARRAPALAELTYLEDGCLADRVPSGLPDYGLDADQRGALRTVIQAASALSQPLPPEVVLAQGLEQFDCLACHARGDQGGAQGSRRAAFSGSADLGDEGRIPPDLTGVGAKLRPAALREVIAGELRVRPYMHTRMPHFGDEAVGHLVEAFLAVDGNARVAPADSSTATLSGADAIWAGHRLAGTTGLSCITCHTTAGQPSLGVAGMDLAVMHERLQPDWFRRWMDDPIAMRDGTRMPSYFENGRSILGRILDGDATAQIDALWAWMSLGDALPLPEGVVVDRAAYDVVPVEQPAYVGTFMKGLSARVLAVGFPANVHLAYDGQHVRLARIWRGQFFDASGTWRGRAGQLVEPAGDAVQELPPGPSFALTDGYNDKGWMPSDSLTPWPDVGAQEADWRFLGHTRGPDGQPTFRSSWPRHAAEPKILVEETISPGLDEGGGHLVRSFELQMAVGQRAPALRAAVSSLIEELPSAPDENRFRTAEGLTVLVRSAHCRLRVMDTGTELLVVPHVFWPQVDEERGRYPPRPKRAGFEVVLRW